MDTSAIRDLERPGRIRAEFFFDEDVSKEFCKISIIGDPSNLIKRVTPEVIAQFPKEYELYRKQSGQRDEVVEGTPLREIPGVDRDAASVLRYHTVRTVEEFAALDEQTVRGIGAGFLNFWRSAKLMLEAKEAEKLRALLAEAEKPKRGPGRPRKDEQPELGEQPDAA